MALFKKDSASESSKNEANVATLSWVVKNPRITEKAAMLSSNNVYTFDVAPSANKIQIKQAIKETYKVSPIDVNIVSQDSRKVTKRGRTVHQKATKKAMVKLKKGDTIELA